MVLEVFGGDPVVGYRRGSSLGLLKRHGFLTQEGIVDLQIKRGVLEPVPLQLEYPSSIVETWADWVDEELVDNEFVEVLQKAGVFEAIVISRGLNILRLTAVESVIEEELIEGFGGKGASFGGHLAKHSTWVTTFRRRLAIKISSGNCFPLAPMFLGHLYTHLDLLHADELVGASYCVVASVINMSLLQACLWEHLKEYRSKCRKLKDVAAKFEKMPSVIANKSGQGLLGALYSNLVSGFASRSLLLLMHGFAIGASGLREGDMTRISYLASVKAGWLPAWSPQGIKYVAYCTHRVTRQFWFDQDIPGSNLEVLVEIGACTKRIHDYWARIMGIFVEYVRGGTQSDIPMPGLCIEPPSNFRILRNVASRERLWFSSKGWAMLSGMKRSQVGRFLGLTFPRSGLPPILPSLRMKEFQLLLLPSPLLDVLAMSEPVSPSTVVTRGSARRMRSQSKLVIAPIGKDEKGSRDLPINLSVGDKSPSGGKETSAKAVKAFAGDVDAVVDVGNALAEEGRVWLILLEAELIVEGGTAGIDLDIDLVGNDGVETARAYIELPPIVGVETRNDSIRDDASIVPPHTSPATHDSLGIESTKVVEPATIASRPTEELSRPFNFDDYFVGLGAFLDTMRSSCVGLPMTRDKLIAHAAPTSEGDPYDDVDDNLVVREVLAPFSGEMVDTSSSFGDGVEVSPARGDDLDLTLRVPYSRLRGELSTFFNVFLLGINEDYGRGGNLRPAFPYQLGRGFKFGYGSGSFYLHLLSGMLCDMRRTPLELVTEGKLQDWRGVARELIDLGFAVDFLLERIREVARMYFGRKASTEVR
uniref:Aminotransferase-like plant mobile domain-containing protein n=1 Tax=Fagus sylvatica TaxID=28930 RepID=A0A2N9GJG1_FAGSY